MWAKLATTILVTVLAEVSKELAQHQKNQPKS